MAAVSACNVVLAGTEHGVTSVVSACALHGRDLKLDNTLLDGSLPARIKLCDFGFAKGWSSNASINMQTLIG